MKAQHSYPRTEWNSYADGIHRLNGWGGMHIAPSVLAHCGPSEQQPGKFWWGVQELRGYEDTLDAAKQAAESHLEYKDPVEQPA